MAAAERRLTRMTPDQCDWRQEQRTVRPFGVNGALGCKLKARLPIMIMDQQKSPKNLPEETQRYHNRSGQALPA